MPIESLIFPETETYYSPLLELGVFVPIPDITYPSSSIVPPIARIMAV